MFVAGIDDYAVDVARVAGKLPSPPVLIGHSMGAAVVERLIAAGPVRAAALLALSMLGEQQSFEEPLKTEVVAHRLFCNVRHMGRHRS